MLHFLKAGRNLMPMPRKRKPTHPIHEADPGYPLSYNQSNKSFYKTLRSKRYYFGGDPVEALRRYNEEWSYLVRGEATPEQGSQLTVGDLFNHYLTDRHKDLKAQRIGRRHFDDMVEKLNWIATQLGKTTLVCNLKPATMGDLSRAIDAKTSSPDNRAKLHTQTRMAFKWALENDLPGYDKPVRFGSSWRPPQQHDFDIHRHKAGRQTFTADEVRQLIDNANPTLKASILLGINGGMESNDIQTLEQCDRQGDYLDYLREKTKRYRRIPLWRQTIDAIDAAPYRRNRHNQGRLLVARTGRPYRPDEVFLDLKRRIGVELPGAGFGHLRHTFRSVADGIADANAVRRVMGHRVGKGAESNYIRDIEDERLRAVVDLVHDWLYG